VKPLHYYLYFEPDLEKFEFRGKTAIDIETEVLSEKVVLNSKDLAIWKCTYEEKECRFEYIPEQEELVIFLPQQLKGIFSLQIEFSGIINDTLLGFYRSKYTVNGETRYMAVTQFEERHARKAFPCFDHPAKKATFDIEFLVDNKLQAISNTQIKEEVTKEGNKKLIKFERTPKMSTYLIFLGVGEFEFLVDESIRPTIRIVTPPGLTKYGNFALDMGRKSIQYGEEFTGIEYPLTKCDYIAIKDFAFGAMENFGAITFRENLLLVYPGLTSKAGIARIASIIAHETAHMWFGDIVSPEDWKYVWLNESFASYFTYAIPDKYFPEWKQWENFLQNTIPIELPGKDAEIRFDSSTAPIIYNKGAAIIRSLEDYLGLEKFKKGIKHFLQKYKFEASSTDKYWQAFEEATGEPISEFANSWVNQKGYPLISVTIENNHLLLSQERFFFTPKESEQLWFIPISILVFLNDGTQKVIKKVFKSKNQTIELPTGTKTVKLNYQQKGFYRVKYTEDMLEKLGSLIKEKKLSAIDTYGIEQDLFSLMHRGDFTIKFYLEFIERFFLQEDRYLPILNISNHLERLYLISERYRTRVLELGKEIFEKVLEQMNLEPQENDSLHISSLRNSLLWKAFEFGSTKISSFGEMKFQDYLNKKEVHSDILSSVLKIGAALDKSSKEVFISKIFSSDTAEVEKLYILSALSVIKDKNFLQELVELSLEKVPSRNRSFVLSSVAENPETKDWLWEWFEENFTRIEKAIPAMHLGRVILPIATISGLHREERVKEFLTKLALTHKDEKKNIEMALETLEINSRLSKSD